jgi:hypothetical protein
MFQKEELNLPIIKDWFFPIMLSHEQLTDWKNKTGIGQISKRLRVQFRRDHVRKNGPPEKKIAIVSCSHSILLVPKTVLITKKVKW